MDIEPTPPQPPPKPKKRSSQVVLHEPEVEDTRLRKPVNTLAMQPKSHRITVLGRKVWNKLLKEAQQQGMDEETHSSPLREIVRGIDFNSKDFEQVKKHLRAMITTLVEWQSPTKGEGAAWEACAMLAHAKLEKRRGGEVWVEWSYAVNMRQELLQPYVWADLDMEILFQFSHHPALALYEICARYKGVGRTPRQDWNWWRPVLTGKPDGEKTANFEYRMFKRDVLNKAVAQINQISDLEVELKDHKEGRFVKDIQFLIRPKKQRSLLASNDGPVDLALLNRAEALDIDAEKAETLISEFGPEAFQRGLDGLERRVKSDFAEPVRDSYRYLKSMLPSEAKVVVAKIEEEAARADPTSPESRREQEARMKDWNDKFKTRIREELTSELQALPVEQQAVIAGELLEDLTRRNAHASILKRLQTSGWNHNLVRGEMVRFYGLRSRGEGWDQPTAEQLLQVAAESRPA